jgi:hypothetical protein
LEDEQSQPKDAGLRIAGIDTLEIRRDVRMRLQLETDSLLPGDAGAAGEPGSDARRENEDEPNPPVEVTCSGSFTFDFVRYQASLDRDVDLRQINPNGPSDRLVCNQLDIRFAPKQQLGDESKPVVLDPGERQQQDLGRLQPSEIIAKGRPVIVSSPSRNAEARGEGLHIVLRDQRVRIASPQGAMLVYGPNILRAPTIDYRHPPRDSAAAIGRFRAQGAGSMRYVPDPAKPQQVMQAAWQTMVDMNRQNGQLVLTLDGRPQLAFADAGSLTADNMRVYLRELEGKQATAIGVPIAAGGQGGKLQVVPDRLEATGRVDIRSARFTGRTAQLLVRFHIQPALTGNAAAVASSNTPGGVATRFNATSPVAKPGQAFHIDTDKMELEVQLQGESVDPTTLLCNGDVVLREVPLPGAHEQPLEVRGGQLTVDRLNTSTPYITLRGADPTQPAGLAQLAGRGITVVSAAVELEVDQPNIRMRSDGPGKATLLVTRDLNGRESANPIPLDITWQGGLQFDGATIGVKRNVLIAGTDDTLRCDELLARLTKPVQIGGQFDEKSINLSEIDCRGQVLIDHITRDTGGVTSHDRVQLARLAINQQTGAIRGDGPGVIRSTRYGNALDDFADTQRPAGAAQSAPPRDAVGSKLRYLRVDFHRGLAGNLYTRELTLYERIRSVYGPVDAWEQELDASRSEALPPDAMTLYCDELRINEDPVAARTAPAPQDGERPFGPFQLRATGNVKIDGQAPGQGAFSAQAGVASYEQAKKVFVLEGDGRTHATLWREGQQGAPPSARMIRYNHLTGEVSVNGIQYIEITPRDIENARRPAQVR